jgi:hypothetical protein
LTPANPPMIVDAAMGIVGEPKVAARGFSNSGFEVADGGFVDLQGGAAEGLGAVFDVAILGANVAGDEEFARDDFETVGDFFAAALEVVGRGLDFEKLVDHFFDLEVLETFDAWLWLGLTRGGFTFCVFVCVALLRGGCPRRRSRLFLIRRRVG